MVGGVFREAKCMHNQPPAVPADVPDGVLTHGVVVCAHVFGVGVYLPAEQDFGHVNVPHMGVERIRDMDDYPAVGSALHLRVVGRSGSGQLRLTVEPPQ